MYRAVFLDIDGTILNSKNQLEDETIESIHKVQKKGIIVGLASGRSLEASKIYGDKLQCWLYAAYNGSLVFLNNKIIHDVKISSKVAYDLCSQTYQYGGKYIHFSYSTSRSNQPLYEEHLLPFAKKTNLEDTDCEAHRLTLYINSEQRKVLKEKVLEDYVFEEGDRLEVYPKGSKWTGIQSAIQQLNILPEEVIAIGNGINDVEMLESSGLGIAMGNATDYVKSKANMIVEDNDHYGVARALRTIFKI
ncbi:HAD family hydrolase [Aeribacillus pallidus]|uniref:HAD family hydrolase n=1 Tax=Aeribacillus sp. FSL k6-2211 TaxID=2954608 RepID=UPI0030D23739